MKQLSVLLLSAIILTACGPSALVFEGDGFQLEYPDDWEVVNTDSNVEFPGVEALFISIPEDADEDSQQALFVMTRQFPEQIALDIFVDENVTEAQESFEYTVLEDDKTTIAEQETVFHVFSAREHQEAPTQVFLQTYLMQGSKGYIVTAVVPEEAPGAERNTLERYMKSFTFITSETPPEEE